VKFTLLAQQDLQQIYDYIADDNPDAALLLIERLEKRCRLLTAKVGRNRGQIEEGLRSIAEGKYIIFFCATGSDILIVRVLHGAREIEKVFEPPFS
jgi:toxin ParE1/3/4